MNILVTNDDGIDSVGLHVLAQSMSRHGEVTIICPDTEYSGAGASIGALHVADPEIRSASVAGVRASWTVSGPPALCVFYARLGAFGFTPDLIVSGINPGANVGRAVYHSGTIGAVLTGRNANIPGIAVSQSFADPLEDTDEARRNYDERVSRQLWSSAADIASEVVEGMMATGFDESPVMNLNVPNLPIEEIKGWRWTEVGRTPPWAVTEVKLVERDGKPGSYRIEETWGGQAELPPGTDGAAVQDKQVSVSLLSRISALPPAAPEIDKRLGAILP